MMTELTNKNGKRTRVSKFSTSRNVTLTIEQQLNFVAIICIIVQYNYDDLSTVGCLQKEYHAIWTGLSATQV